MHTRYGLSALVIALCALMGAREAQAHAISIGFENAGSGSVNIWLGTYEHGGHHVEGSLELEGVAPLSFGPLTQPFTVLTDTKPAGLVDGVTNFYVQYGGGQNSLPLVGTQDDWLAGFPTLPVNHWQGVNFSGLPSGTYQFTWVPAPSPSAEWSPWSSAMNGTFDLTGVLQPPPVTAPEPSLGLLVPLGLAVLARRRMRRVGSDT